MKIYRDNKHLIGTTIGSLFVLDNISFKNNTLYFKVKCVCGKEKYMSVSNLKKSQSCGCINKGSFKHGLTKSITYSSWKAMKKRCYCKLNVAYERYGGAGITVCERWINSFDNFLKDMGERPEGTTLDRIDNNGNYSPENCRWATKLEQDNNRKTNRFITFEGKTKTIAEWSREKKIHHSTILTRIDELNWSIRKSLTKIAN